MILTKNRYYEFLGKIKNTGIGELNIIILLFLREGEHVFVDYSFFSRWFEDLQLPVLQPVGRRG